MCGELAHVVEAVRPRAGSNSGATAALQEAGPGRPQPLQSDVLLQAHAAHRRDRTAKRPYRHSELAGEVGRVDGGGRIRGDIVVDQVHEPG